MEHSTNIPTQINIVEHVSTKLHKLSGQDIDKDMLCNDTFIFMVGINKNINITP
uniref:Uncharacterized protein n=1 Tax=Rhizophora mucronata TaxID=61149 RepID=A0A2P2NI34_RHIMU